MQDIPDKLTPNELFLPTVEQDENKELAKIDPEDDEEESEADDDDDDDDDDDVIFEDIDPDEVSDDEKSLDGLLSELSGLDGATINVYRNSASKYTALEYCFSATPANTSLGDLMRRARDEFGSGDYRIHIKKDGRLVRNKAISIAKPINQVDRPLGNNNDKIMELMMTNVKEKEENFFKMAELFKGNNNQPTMNELIQQMVGMKEMLGLQTPKQQNPMEVMKSMLEMKLMFDNITEGKQSETNINDSIIALAKEALPHLAELGKHTSPVKEAIQKNIQNVETAKEKRERLKKLVKALLLKRADQKQTLTEKENIFLDKVLASAKQGVKPAILEEPTIEQIPGIEPANSTKEDKEMEAVKQLVAFLITKAEEKADPKEVAFFVIDALTDEQLEQLHELLESRTYFIQLCFINAYVKEHKQWFNLVKDQILLELNETVEDLTESDMFVKTVKDEEPDTNQNTAIIDT